MIQHFYELDVNNRFRGVGPGWLDGEGKNKNPDVDLHRRIKSCMDLLHRSNGESLEFIVTALAVNANAKHFCRKPNEWSKWVFPPRNAPARK